LFILFFSLGNQTQHLTYDRDILLLGKMPLSKKAHEKSLMSIEQSLMAGPNFQAGWGKDGATPSLGKWWLL
jgi:hypothetical protein